MDNDLLLYQKCRPDSLFIEQVFNFDIRSLEQTEDMFISKAVIALSQYLVYFKSQLNSIQAELTSKERLMEAVLFDYMTAEVIKKYKTKKDARFGLVYTNPVLNKIQIEIDTLSDQLVLLEDRKSVV